MFCIFHRPFGCPNRGWEPLLHGTYHDLEAARANCKVRNVLSVGQTEYQVFKLVEPDKTQLELQLTKDYADLKFRGTCE